jgi:hypothetical protein
MSFFASLKTVDAVISSAKKDPTTIAMEAFDAKLDVQLKYAQADKAGTDYSPERTRKEPAKRAPLNLRWYKLFEARYVSEIKVGRQPIQKDGKPIIYEIGKDLDAVIAFFEGLKKAVATRDEALVSVIMAAKTKPDEAAAPAAQTALQPAEAKPKAKGRAA